MCDACQLIHERITQLPRFGAGFSPDDLPANGLYIMFERGELAHGTDRIVRVGTHSGSSNLAGRLREHFYKQNKDRSIFRKHIGRCLLASRNDSLLEQWNLDLTTRATRERHAEVVNRSKLEAVEQEVSDYLTQNLRFTVLQVEHKADRIALESGLLSTIASCDTCHPSQSWLGFSHPNATIRSVGLWNIQGLAERPFTVNEIMKLL